MTSGGSLQQFLNDQDSLAQSNNVSVIGDGTNLREETLKQVTATFPAKQPF